MGTTNLLEIIDQTIDYIEKNIKSNLTLDVISSSLHVSKFHLHRIIRVSTGMPLMEYIRARKLSHSVAYLFDPTWKIIDISLEYNFDHEQTYIRAFKKQFGVTPASFRKGTKALPIMEKYDLSKLTSVAEGVVFDPYFVMKPACYLAGKRYDVGIEDNFHNDTANAVGNEFFYRILPGIPNKHNENVYIGLTKLLDDPTYTHYCPSVEVHSFAGISQDLELTVLPPQKYIVFKYMGDFHPKYLTYHQLHYIWSYIDSWLPHSQYQQIGSYVFECIDVGLALEDYCEVDLYIPIKNKQ